MPRRERFTTPDEIDEGDSLDVDLLSSAISEEVEIGEAGEAPDLRQMQVPSPGEVPEDLLDRDELASWVMKVLRDARNERRDFVSNIEDWKEAYDAPKAEGTKNWPIRDAANLKVPVIKEVVNTLSSTLLQTILEPEPTWVMQDIAEEWTPFKQDLERFMDVAARRQLDFDDRVEDFILEGTKLGTSIIEVGHEVNPKKQYIYDEDGRTARPEEKFTEQGPVLWNVPLQDFFIPFHAQSIEDAKWCGKRMRYSPDQLKDRVASGKFREEVVKEMFQWEPDQEEDDVTEREEELQDMEPVERKNFQVFELWFSWNLDDGDDRETELLAYWSPLIRRFLAVRFNPFWHGKRPFVSFRYFPKEHRFYGQGICEQLEDLQEEITTIHNQRLDNAKMANVRMVVVEKMRANLKPGDPMYTGKIIEADDTDAIEPFQLSEIYPSTIENERIARGYVERVSGVDESQSVGGKPVTRTTASAQQMLLQEGKRRLDQTIRKLRKGVSRTGQLSLSIYFQFGAGDKPLVWLGKRGRIVQSLFRLPRKASEGGIGVTASAPTSRMNKETQRQNSLALFNLMVQLYEKFLQLAGQVAPQSVPVVSGALVSSAKKFMFDVLQQFDVTDPEDVLAGLTVLERVLPAPEDLGGMEAFERGEREAEFLTELEELESVLRASGRAEDGGGGASPGRQDFRRVLREEGFSRGDSQRNRADGQPTQGQGGGQRGIFPGS